MQILQHAICVREYGNGKCRICYSMRTAEVQFTVLSEVLTVALLFTTCMQSSLWHLCVCVGWGEGYEQCRHRRKNRLSSSFSPTPPSPTTSKAQFLPLYLCVVCTASICQQMGEEVEPNKRQQNYMPLLISYFYDTIYCKVK
jgi:hypothetical protein